MDLDDDELWFTKYKRNYVSKDKIRENIEDYNQLLREKNWEELTELGLKNRIIALKELLEE